MIDKQSRERILVGDVSTIMAQAGQIFQGDPERQDWGIDGEIEFKTPRREPEASGRIVYQRGSSREILTCESKNATGKRSSRGEVT